MDDPHSHHLAIAVVVGAVAGGLGVVGLVVAATVLGVDFTFLAREPQWALGGAFYAGAFSNLGIVVWSVPAVVTAFAAFLTRDRQRLMLAAASLLTWALLLDDLFLLHENVYPKLRIEGELLMVLYGIAVLGVLWLAFPHVGIPGLLALGIALAAFGVSGVIDEWEPAWRYRIVVEDGAKFIGICLWATIWSVVSLAAVRERFAQDAVAQVPVG